MKCHAFVNDFPDMSTFQAIRDWADGQHVTEVLYDRAVTLLVGKGHSKEVLDACLDEYASLDVWVLDVERNITFVD